MTARPTPRKSQRATAATTAQSSAGRLSVLVVSDQLVASHPLPDHGALTLGRSQQCEIVIDDASLSRHHARLEVGPPLAIRDLGSVNGTRVRGERIEPERDVEIAPGEAIQIGSATLIVQRQSAPIRPRRLWTHDYFELRLHEECGRAARRGSTFAIVRVACPASTPAISQAALADLARVSDVVGEYGPHEYELLLVDCTPEEAQLAATRIATGLAGHAIAVRLGLASYPRDGRNPDELIARASAALRDEPGAPAPDPVPRTDVLDGPMQELHGLAGRIANGTISVLILGETGVGKEVLAESIHQRSPRATGPYLRLNCAALTESLLETELFGHERGAFTGAVATKPGLLETADGGSVFLDEIGELPISTQVKLLRVIEERMVLRVGGLKPRRIDVRFIAATNRDLEADIARGTFRQDLFYRLNGATLVIPPLRERAGEIAGLAGAFVAAAARQANLRRPPELSPAALDALVGYSWPGNIRELRNMLERAVLLAGDARAILPEHLSLEKMRVAPANAAAVTPTVLRRGPQMTAEQERAQIEAALLACGGNQTRAAQMLGIGRRTLVNRLKEFGLARPRKR